ncbi:Nucleolar protein 13 [Diatrype stigma]|uniref:Nucleolar protein 13 n=1 Tax=Diatrype stigma TaxID=117547 RepID=A0AAN9UQ82_9PEZI
MPAVTAVETEAPVVKDEAASSKKRKSQVDEIEVDLALPEPPSKKAKRLLKKGKPLPVKPASDDEAEENDGVPPSKPTTKDGKEKKRSDHGIWIGNLPFYLTRVELFKWLIESSGGTLKEENITRVNLPMVKTKKGAAEGGRTAASGDGPNSNKPQNRGFAYVDFDSETGAVAAMALTETELDGRKVLIKNAKSFEGRPQAPQQQEGAATTGRDGGAAGAAANKEVPASRKVYVGNLSFQATEDDLRAQFERCGEIEWVKVATFEDSGKCKGFGWVKFKEAESAAWAAKGFVRIKEEIETEDDFREEKDKEEGGDAAPKEERKYKMRKWYVNRLHGRELKIDYAEDDQTRYRKRFKKGDGPERKTRSDDKTPRVEREGQGARASRPAPPAEKKKTYGDAGVASYLTGSVVESQGKKITFD